MGCFEGACTYMLTPGMCRPRLKHRHTLHFLSVIFMSCVWVHYFTLSTTCSFRLKSMKTGRKKHLCGSWVVYFKTLVPRSEFWYKPKTSLENGFDNNMLKLKCHSYRLICITYPIEKYWCFYSSYTFCMKPLVPRSEFWDKPKTSLEYRFDNIMLKI